MFFRKMTDFYDAAMGMSDGCIVTLDNTGTILSFNSYLEKISKKTTNQFIGKSWFDIFVSVKEGKESHLYFKNAILQGEKADQIHKIRTCYETDLFIEWNFMLVNASDKTQSGILGTGQDVSRHVWNEKKLLKEKFNLIEQNKELKCLYGITKLFENPDLILDEIFQSVSDLLPQAFQFPDIASANIVIDDKSFRTGKFDKSRYKISEEITIGGSIRGRVDISYPEESFLMKKQTTIFIEEERSLLKTVVRQLAFVFEKKENNDRHLKLERQLHHSDRLATVGQLAVGIAHELNGPLNNILGYAQLSSKQQDLPEQVYLDLDNIIRFSLHAREIVKQVMLFSRQMPPKHEIVNLNKVVEESLYFTEPLCKLNNIEILSSLSEDLPEIMADFSQLRQVVVNLMVNAAQAISKDGGKIKIKTKFKLGKNVSLTIEDTGAGMRPETLMQCFMPFFTTKDVDQGTGLGLSVVHGIIKVHNGTITADSIEGKGSRFHITFPLESGKG